MKRLAAILGLTIFFASNLTQATIPDADDAFRRATSRATPRIHHPVTEGKTLAAQEIRSNRPLSRGQRLGLLMVLNGISGGKGAR